MLTTDIKLSIADIKALNNRKLHHKNGLQWTSTCPFCGGEDRFCFWETKANYWCRHCGAKGFASDAPGTLTIPKEQYEEWQRQQREIEAKERQAQLSILEQINRSPNADRYHAQMLDRSYWYSQGLTDETINRFKLGYTSICPTYPGSPSWTIPVTYQGKLYNIRHRLANPPKPGDKYRPEMAGLPVAMFNADALRSGDWQVVVVEGEVKTMVLTQYGFTTVGIPGCTIFKDKWVKLFPASAVIYIALDPGAEEQAAKIGTRLAKAGLNVKVCQFPVKPDDAIVKYGATPVDVCQFLELGRKV